MNEEYLWDKTGSDAEIEGLENALIGFRYTPVAPPDLPAKAFSLPERPRRNWLKLGFSAAFAAAAIAIVPAVWFLLPNRNIVRENESAKAAAPVPAANRQDDDAAAFQSMPAAIAPRTPDRPVIKSSSKPWKAVAVNSNAKSHPVKLSKEEKYAYGQLMLALSITESKLKIVRDTIAGGDEIKPPPQKEKDLYQK